MTCPVCSNPVSGNLEFCPGCGWELAVVSDTSASMKAYMNRKLDMYRKRHQEYTQRGGKIATLSKEIADAKSKEESLNAALNEQKQRMAELEAKAGSAEQLTQQLKKVESELKAEKLRKRPI